LYLAPVIFFSIWGVVKGIPVWSYYLSFITALAGAILYYLEAGGMVGLMTPVTGLEHKYAKLLLISGAVMVLGNGYFLLGLIARRPEIVTAQS
ncbi:MAG: sodium:proline symporter, partial [Rhodospirillales bacterium]|nr:sodium:proline symporter [Rhodospirillales bacterium]